MTAYQSAEAGPSSRPATSSSSPLVPAVLRQSLAAYQQSSCRRPRPIAAPSMLEGWFGSSSSKTSPLPTDKPKRNLMDMDVDSHVETPEETNQRMIVEQWADSLFKWSPMVRFMSRHLSLVSCDPQAPRDHNDPNSSPRIEIVTCPKDAGIAGGFSFDPENHFSKSGIIICANHILDKTHLEDTLAHEMIHWWDHCRFKVDWNNLRQHACSEVSYHVDRSLGVGIWKISYEHAFFFSHLCRQIRAASLSGDCAFYREVFTRGNKYSSTKQHQVCTRRRAVTSVATNPGCKSQEEAERAVDEVWKSCFGDTRPFDEVSSEARMLQVYML